MPAKRIFVLNGHPAEKSLNRSLAEAYATAATAAGHDVRLVHLKDLDFDADFGFAVYKDAKSLEPDLEMFQANVAWSDHIVLTTPMWWGGLPAKLKGLFDRAFTPGWAFDPRQTKGGLPLPLLKGRTARVIMTADTPKIFFRLLYGNAMKRQLKGQIFHFVGIKPVTFVHFAPASKAAEQTAKGWIKTVATFGRAGT